MQFIQLALAVASFGSVIAAPAPAPVQETRDTTIVSSVYTAVSGLSTLVEGELVSINTSVVGVVVDDTVVPVVNDALANIVTEVNSVIGVVTPLVNDIVFPLVAGELENVPEILTEVHDIVDGIVTTVTGIVSGLPAEILSLVEAEVSEVIKLLEPFLAPIVTLVEGVLASAVGPIVVEVEGLLVDVNGILAGVLDPVADSVLSKIN